MRTGRAPAQLRRLIAEAGLRALAVRAGGTVRLADSRCLIALLTRRTSGRDASAGAGEARVRVAHLRRARAKNAVEPGRTADARVAGRAARCSRGAEITEPAGGAAPRARSRAARRTA